MLICLCLTSFCILVYAVKLLRHALYSPLNAAKDAHWSVRFYGAWIWWQRVFERDAQAVHEAHLRLGPVLRLGPSEVSVCDVEGGLKPIYEGRLPKTDFYQVASSYGEAPMVGMRDEKPHQRQKKLVAKPYGKSYLMANQEWHAEQEKLADNLVSGLEMLVNASSDLELYDVFFAWSVASISAYVFGSAGCLNLLHDIPGARKAREGYFSQRTYLFVASVLPIPSKLFHWMGYRPEVPWIWEMQARADGVQNSAPNSASKYGGRIIVYDYMKQGMRVLKGKKDTVETRLSAKEIAIISSEMQDHIVAGIDTSTAALTACAWLLSLEHNRHWQYRLREETRSVRHFSQHRDFEQLPVLDAIVKETLRLYPPVIGGQPRMTDKPVVLGPREHEVVIPPGVKVHAQAQTLHRNRVFEDAENFHPERWLDSTPEKIKEMDRWFWAFGSGPRKCIGEHLGLSNLKIAISSIWENFETRVTERTELTLSQGLIAMPLPSKDGDYMRLHLRKVET